MVHTDHQRIGFQALYADFSSQDKNHFQTAQSKNYVFKEIQNKANNIYRENFYVKVTFLF